MIMVVQNRALKTRYYERHVLKTRDNDACRVYGRGPETVLHILNLCQKYQFTLMQKRHDDYLRHVYCSLSRYLGIDPPSIHANILPVVENERGKLVWDVCLNTFKEMEARRPDMVFYDFHKKWIVVFDMTCPGDARLDQAFKEKLAKYQELRIDLERLNPGFKAFVSPVVLGSLGSYTEEMRKSLTKVHPAFEGTGAQIVLGKMQQSSLLGSMRIVKSHLAPR